MPRPRLISAIPCVALLTLALSGCENTYPPLPEVWVDPPLPTHQPAAKLPAASAEGAGPEGSLLASFAERDPRKSEEGETWTLPFQAKAAIVELLIGAAKDDPARLAELLSERARWGVPDRRELRARPIFSDADPLGLEFLAAIRKAASRFGAKASFSCTPLQPGWQILAATGAEPMWCSYTSNDRLDIMAFRLMVESNRVKVDYVGFFEERQPQAIRVVGVGDAPPIVPYFKRPVPLELPELMPGGRNPVVQMPKRRLFPKVDVQIEPKDKGDGE